MFERKIKIFIKFVDRIGKYRKIFFFNENLRVIKLFSKLTTDIEKL